MVGLFFLTLLPHCLPGSTRLIQAPWSGSHLHQPIWPLCQEAPSLWCSRDRRSLLKELYILLLLRAVPRMKAWPERPAPGNRHLKGSSLWAATHLDTHPSCLSPGYTSQLSRIPVSPRGKAHLALEIPKVVLARVPSTVSHVL